MRFHNETFQGLSHVYQDGRLIKQSDNNGNCIEFEYDEAGYVLQIKNNSNAYLSFSYQSKSQSTDKRVSQIKDQSGRTWQLAYDLTDTLCEISTPSGGKRLYNYQHFAEPSNRDAYLLTHVTNSLNHPILIASYNEAGQVDSYKALEDNIEYQYSYFGPSTIAKTSEQDSNITYHLDEHGLVDSITLENGKTASQQWDDKTRTATITHYSGSTETKTFDAHNRLIKQIETNGEEIEHQYQGGNPEPSLIKKQTGEIKNRYDRHYNLLSTTDEKNRTEKYKYNSRGDITQISDIAKNKTSYQYNDFSQPSAIIDAKGNATKIEYDALGREKKLIDAEGRETELIYDQDDAITQIIDPLKNPIGLVYDHENQLQSITDPAGNQTHFEFGQLGRLNRQRKPDNSTVEYEYTELGRVSKLSRADGSVIRFEYNEEGLLIRQITDNHITEFEYDESENLIGARTPQSSTRFSYNKQGNIDGEEQNDIVIEKVFDKHAKTSLRFLDQQTTYLRNSEGLLQGIFANNKPSIRFEYDDNDAALSKRVYRNQQTEKIKYNASGGIKKINTAGKRIKYKSDKTGLITQKGDTKYQYDNNGRLINAGEESFQYDAVGNHTQYRYHPTTNQLLENQAHIFEYDDRGNLNGKTHKQSKTKLAFEFNSLDQLVRVSGEQYDETTKQINNLSLEYQYDALNRRITKTHNGKAEHYLYDQLAIIAILDENRQTKATIIHDDEIDTPLSITNQNGTFYYHRDHQGSIIALTNEAGETVESIQYDDSYGKIVEHQKIVETNNPYCYTGRELDTNELYYYRARYYDPTSQQFLSEDPIGFLSGDFNFYRYVGNDPVNWIDAFGFKRCDKNDRDKRKKSLNNKGDKLRGRFGNFGKKVKRRLMAKGVISVILVAIDGPFPIGDAIAAALLASEIAQVANDVNKMKEAIGDIRSTIDDMVECEKEAEKKEGANVKGKKDKCDMLAGKNQCQGGDKTYYGGDHKTLKTGGNSCSPPRQSHHTPAKSAYDRKKTGTNSRGDGLPAIQMDKADHEKTASHGGGGKVYAKVQKFLIDKDLMVAAMAMDIADIKSIAIANGEPNKYDSAMTQMMLWAACKKMI